MGALFKCTQIRVRSCMIRWLALNDARCSDFVSFVRLMHDPSLIHAPSSNICSWKMSLITQFFGPVVYQLSLPTGHCSTAFTTFFSAHFDFTHDASECAIPANFIYHHDWRYQHTFTNVISSMNTRRSSARCSASGSSSSSTAGPSTRRLSLPSTPRSSSASSSLPRPSSP